MEAVVSVTLLYVQLQYGTISFIGSIHFIYFKLKICVQIICNNYCFLPFGKFGKHTHTHTNAAEI